jgi:hypothetical protein
VITSPDAGTQVGAAVGGLGLKNPVDHLRHHAVAIVRRREPRAATIREDALEASI